MTKALTTLLSLRPHKDEMAHVRSERSEAAMKAPFNGGAISSRNRTTNNFLRLRPPFTKAIMTEQVLIETEMRTLFVREGVLRDGHDLARWHSRVWIHSHHEWVL